MMSAYFVVDGLRVGYNRIPLIEDISFSLEKGEILTLIGPNGAGKSTILKSISGQLAPLGGKIRLDGRDFLQLDGKERSRKMAMVFTEKLYAQGMTCREAVEFGRYPYTGRFGILSSEDKRVVDEVMELVQVQDLESCAFEKVSDGQRQRVLLARAICQEPKILLLDEPTSYLDIKYKLEFSAILRELARKKNLAVIMSLHELDLADRISDKLLAVCCGHVENYRLPKDILRPDNIRRLFNIHTKSKEEEEDFLALLPERIQR